MPPDEWFDQMDDDHEEDIECGLCDGSGVSDEERTDLDEPVNHDGDQRFKDCQCCCGFGIINW